MQLVGFGRACAPVRCAHPYFWAHRHAKRGAARPADFSLYSKNKYNLPNSCRPREGLFSLKSTEAREYTECQACRPNWVPPPPQLQESVVPLPLWIQGGRHTHFRMRVWGEPIPTIGHTLRYSKYTITGNSYL
jgi:hypothetical protein